MLGILGIVILFLLYLLVSVFGIGTKDKCIVIDDVNVNKVPDVHNIQNSISKITDGLYISNYYCSLNYDHLKKLGIRQILSVGKELPNHKTDLRTKHIDLDDTPTEDIAIYFNETYAFIDAAPTLVHCFAGISRSVTVSTAYLMRKYRMSVDSALQKIRKTRPIVRPNSGFMRQLKEYENKLNTSR